MKTINNETTTEKEALMQEVRNLYRIADMDMNHGSHSQGIQTEKNAKKLHSIADKSSDNAILNNLKTLQEYHEDEAGECWHEGKQREAREHEDLSELYERIYYKVYNAVSK